MRSALASFGLLLTIGALAACSGSEPPTVEGELTEDELRSGAVSLKDSDEGKTVTVEKGKDVILTLRSNATTGYKWSVVSTDRSFGYPTPKEGTYKGAGADGPIGSGGTQKFVWKTGSPFLEPGPTAHGVTLEYRRSFENDDAPAADTFKFKVKIKQGEEIATPPAAERECPTVRSVNCMPPRRPAVADLCDRDYRDWAQANCEVSYLD